MKRIVTTTCVFPPPYPSEVILNRLAAIGYTSLDIGLDYCVGKGDLLDGDNWRERVMALRRQADALGVTYTHSHAPGNAGNRSEAQMRALEAAALLGARYIVVHPIHEMDGQIITDDAGQDWIFYHGYDVNTPNAGRKMYLDRVQWVDGWPQITVDKKNAYVVSYRR